MTIDQLITLLREAENSARHRQVIAASDIEKAYFAGVVDGYEHAREVLALAMSGLQLQLPL